LFGVLSFLLGVLVILTPTVIAPVCDALVEMKSGAFVPMRCHYTAQTEIAIGALLALVGVLLFVWGQRREVALALSVMGAALGVFTILTPTVLIGTCKSPDMECNVATKPALLLLGGAILVVSALGAWLAWKNQARQSAAGVAS
jgi:hypothetical protein